MHMGLLKSIFIFFIHSNLLISFCAVAFFLTGVKLLGVEEDYYERAFLIFVATFLTYNLTIFLSAIYRGEEAGKGKMEWFLRHKKVLYASLFFSFLLLIWFFPFSSLYECLFFLHLGVISVLYNIPDRLANTRYRSIRSIPLIKIFLIAYVWAALGAWYPAILEPGNSNPSYLFVLFFLFILAITLPFDIRDYHSDQRTALLTIPGLIGIRATKLVASGLMLLYGVGMGIEYLEWQPVGILTFFTIVLIWFSASARPDWYYTGLIDSLIILQYLLICLFKTGTNLA